MTNDNRAFHQRHPLLAALLALALGVAILVFGYDLYQDMLYAEANGQDFKLHKGLHNLMYDILGAKGSLALFIAGALLFFYKAVEHLRRYLTARREK